MTAGSVAGAGMPLRVCIITTTFPRWPDDSRGTFVYEAARALCARGAQVRVIAMHNPKAKTHEWMGPIEVIRPRYLWPERWEILQKEGGGLPVMWQTSRWTRLVILPFLLTHILAAARFTRGFDVVHANWTLSAAAALATRGLHGLPIVVTVQGSDMVRATRLPLVKAITQLVLRRCDRVLVLSQALAELTIALGVPDSMVQVLPNGVDIKLFHPTDGEREPILLFVGALSDIKGTRHLIEAMPAVVAQSPGYRLVIIGEGPQRAALADLAQSLDMAQHVFFLGPLPPPQVRMWMQRARLFVLPSLEEGLGVVLLEAMSCGTPCVASRAGGIPDVVVPDVGVLVPPGDPMALAAGINGLLASPPGEYDQLSRQARARAETMFSWEVISARLVSVYRQVVEQAD